MKLLLSLIITIAMSMSFLSCCKSSTMTNSTNRKSIPKRIGDDAKSVGEGVANVADEGLEIVGEAGETVVDAFGGNKDTESNDQ